MGGIERRSFLKASASAVAAFSATTSLGRPLGANDRVNVAVVGCGRQGMAHVSSLQRLPSVGLTWVCDVDQKRLENARQKSAALGCTDLRELLDDNTLDAVIVATPDHWHAPAALLALQAGKHVYVEKPFAHNYRESKLLHQSASSGGLVVQHGTQSRTNPAMKAAVGLLHSGVIGEVLTARCWNWQRRESIGQRSPTTPPAHVDYDAWIGPSRWSPFQANRFHYDWHWWHDFGTGGIGNDGAHELDYTLWGMGLQAPPTQVTATGDVYYFRDDREWPDTQQVSFQFRVPESEFPNRLLTYEQRLWSTSYPFNVDAGAEFFGTTGRMLLSKRGKVEVRDEVNRRVPVDLPTGFDHSVAPHQLDWIKAIRSGLAVAAGPDPAHLVSSLIHLGNIATRVGRALSFDAASGAFVEDGQASSLLSRSYRKAGHWAIPAGIQK